MRNISLTLGFFLLVSLVCFAASPRIVIQSGHLGGINRIVYQAKNEVILSAGDDGSVKIWQATSGELLYNIQLSHLAIMDMVVHPDKPAFTALVQTSLTSSDVISYDWLAMRELFSFPLSEVPLFIDYSSLGNYFIYGRAEWDSLVLCNAVSGKSVPYLNKGFGIVSFSTTSASEKRIMAYQPSGKIIYKDIITGEDLLTKPLSVPAYLKAISISSNSKFIAATKEDTLYIINITNGETVATVPAAAVVDTLFNHEGTQILCLQKKSDGKRLIRFWFDGKQLKEFPFSKVLPGNFVRILYIKEKIYLADTDGKILTLNDQDTLEIFGENKLLRVDDIAVSASNFALGTRNKVIVVDFSLLMNQSRGTEGYTFFKTKLGSEIGLDFFKPNKLLIWNKHSSPNEFYFQDINSGEISPGFEGYQASLAQLDIVKSGILSLEQSGTARIITKREFEPLFQYETSGINKIAYVSDETLIAARSKIGVRGSSLLQINPQTGETVPLAASSLLCYDIIYDENKDRLYSLCIEKDNDKTATLLKLNYSKGYEKEAVLARFEGEDMSASVVVDSAGKYVYSTMGFNKILVYNGYQTKTLAVSDAIPRKLKIAGTYLFSINANHTLTVWERYKGTRIVDIYLLNEPDLQWIAIFAGGRCFASEKGWDYLKLY